MNLEARIKLSQLFDLYQKLLSQSQRQTLHLHLIEDLTISEIAKELATTRQAVLDAIQKGIKKLNKISKKVG